MKGIARMLASLRSEQKKSGSDYTGTVTMVKGSTAYVRFTGAEISDTPVSMSVDCKPGDKVRVRVANGRAWLTGNDTKPPTNDTENIRVVTQNAEVTARDLQELRTDFNTEFKTFIASQVVEVPAGIPYQVDFRNEYGFVGLPSAVVGMAFDPAHDTDRSGGTLYLWPKDIACGVVNINEAAVEARIYNATGNTRTITITCIMVGKART